MLVGFFEHLREHRVPVSITEFLTLLRGLEAGVCQPTLDDFYGFSRICLVKDEALYDRFDVAFGSYFKAIGASAGSLEQALPEDWLRAVAKKHLDPAELARLEKLGWDKLMETLQQRLAEQKGRHAGGSKWIGTGGTSPFGNSGVHPEGIRIGGESAGNRTAIKVWDKREFRNLDGDAELGTRNLRIALRKLRRFARQGAADELDLPGTIAATARNAGWLDLLMRPQRHNAVKVLLFLDVGGSMDDHVQLCEQLFSACRAEFMHLEYFYFHNCVYETVWRDNVRRHNERVPLVDVMHTYGPDYKLIFVGDATMSPYEILHPHGSIEHMNREPGAVWLRRMLDTWPAAAWLNPEPRQSWQYRQSIGLLRQIMRDRMYPTTLSGIDEAIAALSRTHTA